MKIDIAQRIRQIRTSKEISIYRISKDTGISPNYISDLENGRRNPSLDTLERLIVPLGITLAELFSTDDSASYLSEKERQLVENYRLLPDEKGNFLLQMSEMLIK
ncbi:MAG: helix-turn-helix transcriptional regulator [Oscillospiraceae bacterium]|nr:helix-turn-helix transcriptional regulator [Oscillospiraceae bacterium]